MTNLSFRRFLKLYIPLGILVTVFGVFIGIFIIDHIIMPTIIGVNKDSVTVPKIVGLSFEAGREKLYGVGLLTEILRREYDDHYIEGSIISQSPESGVGVSKGKRISIVVSKGKELAVIPQIKEMSERQARAELKKRGFSIGTIKKNYSDDIPVDYVIDVTPSSGTTISRDITIELLVSRGPRPTHTEMPNVIGESLADARQKIEESGLVTGEISYIDNSSIAPGTILSQSVSPGAKVPLESSVNLEVSVIN